MKRVKRILLILGLSVTVVPMLSAQVSPQLANAPIQWDAKLKEYTAKEGEAEAHFTFALKNTTAQQIIVTGVRTSCGCTVAELPSKPWPLAPGEGGEIGVTVDLRGKYGTITKSVFVDTSVGKVINRGGLRKLMERIGIRSDVPNCHPHRFRHTFAIQFLRNGGNIYRT